MWNRFRVFFFGRYKYVFLLVCTCRTTAIVNSIVPATTSLYGIFKEHFLGFVTPIRGFIFCLSLSLSLHLRAVVSSDSRPFPQPTQDDTWTCPVSLVVRSVYGPKLEIERSLFTSVLSSRRNPNLFSRRLVLTLVQLLLEEQPCHLFPFSSVLSFLFFSSFFLQQPDTE
jgi:hypothetical protein